METTPTLLALLAGALFLGAMVRSIVGFGDALVAMSVMALLVEPDFAAALMGLCSATVGLGLLAIDWHQIDVRQAWRLLVGAALGLPVGILCLKVASPGRARIVLGAFLLVYVMYELFLTIPPTLRRVSALPYVFGFLAGLFGGFTMTPGPPVVAYGRLVDWPADRFRATMTGFSIPFGTVVCASYGLSGLWTRDVFVAYGCAMPALLVGLFLGNAVHRRVPREAFKRAVQVMLVLLGAALVVQGSGAVTKRPETATLSPR